ncbi:MAG TPA: hypothetical protein VN345_02225 [Blastocatellia bacterium]|nr:hypothetical protein [Blastocatellia bacterium]
MNDRTWLEITSRARRYSEEWRLETNVMLRIETAVRAIEAAAAIQRRAPDRRFASDLISVLKADRTWGPKWTGASW